MKLSRIILSTAVLALMSGAAATLSAKGVPSQVRMSKEVLKDKIKGGWAGQTIGCTYGGPTEFKYNGIIPAETPIYWRDHIVKSWFDRSPGLYDDVYMDLTFVEVFQKEGLDAPVESFAKAFANAPYPLWHANKQGRYNILHGVRRCGLGHRKLNLPCIRDGTEGVNQAEVQKNLAAGQGCAQCHAVGSRLGLHACGFLAARE